MLHCQEQLKVNEIKKPWRSCWHPETRFCDLYAGRKQPHPAEMGHHTAKLVKCPFLCWAPLPFIISLFHHVIVLIRDFFSWTIVFLRPIFNIYFSFLSPVLIFFLLSTAFFPQDLNWHAIKAEQISDYPINNQVLDVSEVKTMPFPPPFTCSWYSGEKGLMHCLCCSHHLTLCWFLVSCWSNVFFLG